MLLLSRYKTRKRRARQGSRRPLVQTLEKRRVLAGNPIITEFLASNTNGLEDGFNQQPDWIEIRNDADSAVDLQGYHLTDDPADLNKWEFTSPTVLNPGEYLVVFASSRDLVDPFGNWHTNFQLSAGGEYVALTDPTQAILSEFGAQGADYPPQVSNLSYGVSGESLVAPDSVAHYLIPPDDQLGLQWTEINFDPEAEGFSLGRAAIGYENSPGSATSYSNLFLTEIASGTTNVYQRNAFYLDSAASISDLHLSIHFDDGFAAYLNGTLVASHNAPNPLGYNTPASATHPDGSAIAGSDYDLTAHVGLLEDGENILAIHALNRPGGSSDFLMRPELRSQSVAGPPSYLVEPTPGAANALALDLGPRITDVTASANPAPPNQPLTITANVAEFTSPLDPASVRLHYRRMFNAEVSIVMRDDGTGVDAAAGDGVYSAEIPGSAIVGGEMIRWRVTAMDDQGVETAEPRFFDALDSPEYFGTVGIDSTINTDLPLLQWFLANPNGASTNAGTRVSIFIDGEFYDNLHVDSHGQSTRGSAFPKKSFDFDANSGIKFRLRPGMDRVSDFNLLTNYADQTKLRHTLMYDLFREADYAHHFAFPTMVYRNGSSYGLFDIVEDGDEEYLDRLGRDDDNPLYKVNNRVNHAYNSVEKKSRDYEDHSDFQLVVNGAQNLSGNAATDWDYDHLDIADLVNYLAIHNVAVSSDFGHKNMYWYRDTNGTGLWSVFPWDQDLSLGHQWDARVSPPYFKDDLITDLNIYLGQGNPIFSRIYAEPVFREMYQRRVRTLTDAFYGAPGTSTDTSYLAQHIMSLESMIADEAVQDMNLWGIQANFSHTPAEAADQLLDEFIPLRRAFLNNHNDVPDPQVGNPTIVFDDLDYDADPISGLQNEEYVRLNNPNNVAVDISGWRIDGGIDHRFKGGTVIPAGGTLYVVKDVVAFQGRIAGASSGQRLLIQGNYSGQLSFSGESLSLIAGDGTLVDTLEIPEGTPTDNQKFLRVTEFQYNPVIDDTEFIEFTNISEGPVAATLDLAGVSITNGPSAPYVFPPATTLAAGESVLVVQDITAFQAAYPSVDPATIVGNYQGKLSNSGERLKVIDSGGETLLDVDYGDSDPWTETADGSGASLVLADPVSTSFQRLSKPYSYRGSTPAGGTPGADQVASRGVVINEVRTHTDLPQRDAIELLNTTQGAIDISGWFLSDSQNQLLKFEIPLGTVLPAGGYVVFDEDDFNPTPLNPGPSDFALSGSQGDDVWLVIPDASGTAVTEFVDRVNFSAAFNAQTLGRVPDGSGRMVPLASDTIGSANGPHRASPVLISEVHYHPEEPSPAEIAIEPDLESADFEFVELHNAGTSTVDLMNWRLRGDADFNFTAGHSLASGESLVLVSFDPADANNANRKAAFELHFGIDDSVTLLGPVSGSLGNSYGRVVLQQPDEAPVDEPTVLPRVVVDEVVYDDLSPWPENSDGEGDSLQRVSEVAYGNAAASWYPAAATPGSLRYLPSVLDISFNAGEAQRSLLTSVEVEFDREVDLSAASFEVIRRGDQQVVTDLIVTPALVSGRTIATIEFGAGPLVEQRASGNSLEPGNYELRVVADSVFAELGQAAMQQDSVHGRNAADGFFRHAGDADGDRDVDGTDYVLMGNAFLRSSPDANYNHVFDFDGDGDVDGLDYVVFSANFLRTLPF